jgi:hypothetical protein
VDDIVITACSDMLLRRFTTQLHSEFALTDLGDLSFFLGISVTRTTPGMVLDGAVMMVPENLLACS